MKPLAIASIATLFVACSASAADTAPKLLLTRLAALAGSNAIDCGTIPVSGDRASAIGCARKAAASGNAYRLALQMKGADTYTWQGAARDKRGHLWVVFFDADTSAGPEFNPGLGQLLCRDITFAPDKDEVIDCAPSTGQP
jgi:hypothetical protein